MHRKGTLPGDWKWKLKANRRRLFLQKTAEAAASYFFALFQGIGTTCAALLRFRDLPNTQISNETGGYRK